MLYPHLLFLFLTHLGDISPSACLVQDSISGTNIPKKFGNCNNDDPNTWIPCRPSPRSCSGVSWGPCPGGPSYFPKEGPALPPCPLTSAQEPTRSTAITMCQTLAPRAHTAHWFVAPRPSPGWIL